MMKALDKDRGKRKTFKSIIITLEMKVGTVLA